MQLDHMISPHKEAAPIEGTYVIQKVISDGLLKKKNNLFPNHLYCHLMYIPYTTF
jgi:hypothetical protein